MPEPGERVDLTLAIGSIEELYAGLAPQLCPDGLFIATDEPAAAGSAVGFRVVLPDGVVLIQGRGWVLWTRLPGSIEGPAGMAVQFDSVDPDTRETIDAVIDAHLSTGGELFDLDGRGIRDVYPTDVLDQSATTTANTPRWRRDGELEGFAVGPSTSTVAVAPDADASTGVVDLRFEEAIAGFTRRDGRPERDRVGGVDRAISAAVTTPVNPQDSEGSDEFHGAPGGLSGRSAGDEIPDILDQWREELRIAGRGPGRSSGGSLPLDGTNTPWESLLPFGEDDRFPRPEPGVGQDIPRRSSTARRSSPAAAHRDRRRLVVAAVAVIVIVVAAVILVGGRGGEPVPEATDHQPEPEVTAVNQAIENRPAAGEGEAESPLPPATTGATGAPPVRAGVVRSVEWTSTVGATEVVITADGGFRPGQVDAIRLADPPRVLVRVRGIGRPYQPYRIDVGSPELTAVRVGHHPELEPPTLYVVLDLAGPAVASANALRVTGDVARVTVRTPSR